MSMKSYGMARKRSKDSQPPYFEMGQRIIEARTKLTDLNQSQMTDALGLKEPTYGNYERGDRRMPPHTMEKFEKLTGCSADYIYLGKGDLTGGSLLDMIKRLNQEHLQQIERQVAYYLAEQENGRS